MNFNRGVFSTGQKVFMKNADIKDPEFLAAVEAIDSGNLPALKTFTGQYPRLVTQRLDHPAPGYFKNPYLLWFIAGNPVRHQKLPANIADITQFLIAAVQQHSPASFQEQLDYTLGLVVTGRVPRESGVQLTLIDLLIDAGARPGNGHGAIAHGNLAAAERLVARGGSLTLATAICLNKTNDILSLAKESTMADREIALVAAAFYGKAEMLTFIINIGVNVNAYPDPAGGFHSHATALHQAVFSGSLEAVKVLVAAGADRGATDLIYSGTPLGWAQHMQMEISDAAAKKKYAAIEAFLRSKNQC